MDRLALKMKTAAAVEQFRFDCLICEDRGVIKVPAKQYGAKPGEQPCWSCSVGKCAIWDESSKCYVIK